MNAFDHCLSTLTTFTALAVALFTLWFVASSIHQMHPL